MNMHTNKPISINVSFLLVIPVNFLDEIKNRMKTI